MGLINPPSPPREEPSRLFRFLNLVTISGLPEWSCWPRLEGREALAYLAEQGFAGVQGGDPADCAAVGLLCAGDGHVYTPADAFAVASRRADEGCCCATVFVGWGTEDDTEVDRLIEAVIAASDRHKCPLYVETHRATATQDIWRTVQIARRHPDVRFNLDLSHYYTGLELTRGDRLGEKLDFLQPVFERMRFMHGRIGSPGCIQVGIGDGRSPIAQEHGVAGFLDDWREMWTRAMAGFLATSRPNEALPFAPELLDGSYYYARQFPQQGGLMAEESDRYAEALAYLGIAEECFAAARERVGAQP